MTPSKDSRIQYTTVEHDSHGCETGCCGHIVYAFDAQGTVLHKSPFQFTHPYGDDHQIWAEDLARTFFPDAVFNWKESAVLDD